MRWALTWPWQVWFDRQVERMNAGIDAHLEAARASWSATHARTREPLVSVTIPTWNRARLLVDRTLPSILDQTYKNFEVIVVGDHCTDDTERSIEQLADNRIRFFNLPKRPPYPEDPFFAWFIAGAWARNKALELANGAWLAHVDDDDVWTEDHIEELLDFAQRNNLELAFGRYRRESAPGVWHVGGGTRFPTGRRSFRGTGVLHSAAMYRSSLSCFRYLTDGWRYGKALDYILTQRMARAGVRGGFLDRVVCAQPLRPGDVTTTAGALARHRGSWWKHLFFKIVSA